jgi:hypothetical protein
MSYAKIDEIIRRTVEDLVAAGASRETVELSIRQLEDAVVQSIIDSHRDQLLLNLDYRTTDLAKRYGVDERTIRNWRKSAIDRKSVSAMTSGKAA